MKKTKLFLVLFLPFLTSLLHAQSALPVVIDVPLLVDDPNYRPRLINFEFTTDGQFSLLYINKIDGSVVAENEFVSAPGGSVYKDESKKELVEYATGAMLLLRQILDRNGKVVDQKTWLLSHRELAVATRYRLSLPEKKKQAFVTADEEVKLSLQHAGNLEGLSDTEKEAFIYLLGQEFFPKRYEHLPKPRRITLGEELGMMKSDFKSLRETGLAFRGDLPKDENVLTRFLIVPEKSFVITESKSKPGKVKCYLTRDYKVFDCMDSIQLKGSVQISQIVQTFDQFGNVVGAFASFQLAHKDEQKVETLKTFNVLLDPADNIYFWEHSVGVNKIASMTPEVCWYEGTDLMVLSNNAEKTFKSYYQVHRMKLGGEAQLLYPLNDEEKRSEKFKYVSVFEDPAVKPGSLPPLPNASRLLRVYDFKGTRYLLTQNSRFEPGMDARLFLSMSLFKVSADNKFLLTQSLKDYNSREPVVIEMLYESAEKSHFMARYPKFTEFTLSDEGLSFKAIETNGVLVVPDVYKNVVQRSEYGAFIMKQVAMGSKFTIQYYPK